MIPESGRFDWRRDRLPTPAYWHGELHGLYSPWGHKELDMTERISLSKILSGNKKIGNGEYIQAVLTDNVLESESEVTQSCPTLCDPMD